MSGVDPIRAALAPVEARLRRAATARGASVGLAVGGIAAASFGGLYWLALGGVGAAVGAAWPVDRRSVAARLDAAAALDGALRCAWDHRDRTTPMAAAQRTQALAALEARRAAIGEPRPDVCAAPRPSPGWLLGPALAILACVMAPGGPPPGAPGVESAPEVSAAAGAAGAAAPEASDGPAPASPEAPPAAEPRAVATPDEASPDAGRVAAADAGAGPGAGDAGAGGAVRSHGVAGRAVGASEGGGAGARPVTARPGEGPALVLPAAAGDRDPGDGPAGRLVVGRTPPPPDAIADPARPYPSRYRRAIAAWFDRSRP